MPLYFFKDPSKNEKSACQHLTLVIPVRKLTKIKEAKLRYLQREFNRCAAYFLEQSRALNTTSPYKLHKMLNAFARQQFNLPSAAIQTARDRGIAIQRIFWARIKRRKATRRPMIAGALPVHLRQDSYRISKTAAGAYAISFACLPGRNNRLSLPLVVRPYAAGRLEAGHKLASAEVYRRGGKWLVSITLKIIFETRPASKMLGVDLGIRNSAVLSSGHFFSKKRANRAYGISIAKEMSRMTMPRRKRNFISYLNHLISRDIIKTAVAGGFALALENLTGIKERVLKQHSYYINSFCNWSYKRLMNFIRYKAALAGLMTVFVDPSNTSITCSRCGFVSSDNRTFPSVFVCKSCGLSLNADLNAARVIAARGAEFLRLKMNGRELETMPPGNAKEAGSGAVVSTFGAQEQG